jgi:predicted metal-dependent hydrolase
MIQKWQDILSVQVATWGVRKMKTKWGSCNPTTQRVWFNLELAKKPQGCLEYIIVHELVHLLERHHGERFKAYMDEFMPQWRLHRDELKRSPLAHVDWQY